jgi:hypothetical protein
VAACPTDQIVKENNAIAAVRSVIVASFLICRIARR